MYYLKRKLITQEQMIFRLESEKLNKTSSEVQTMEDPRIPMLEHDLKNTEITNDNLREELVKVNEQLQQEKNRNAER